MDIIANIRPDPEILKEPRGLLRIVQAVLAIFAFASVTSVQTYSTIFVDCPTGPNTTDTQRLQIQYGYPFRVYKTAIVKTPLCPNEQKKPSEYSFEGNFSSSAEFFCFVGVMSFLACIILIPAYVLFSSFFRKGTLMSKADFIASCVWTVMWFIASTAWADNISKLMAFMSPDNLIEELGSENCEEFCRVGQPGDPSTLIVSVLFGYINMGLEGASLWFLFKETDWYSDKSNQANGDAQADFDQPYADPGYQTPEYVNDPSLPTTPTAGGLHSSYGSNGQPDYYEPANPAY